jgi:hypothetical protein
MQRSADSPSDDTSGKDINDKSHENEATPGCHEGNISDPQLIWPDSPELPVHQISWSGQCIVAYSRSAFGTPHNALYSQSFHQTLYRTACNINMLSIKLSPDFTGTVDLEIDCPDSLDFRLEPSITP